jgi:hypothetical protein
MQVLPKMYCSMADFLHEERISPIHVHGDVRPSDKTTLKEALNPELGTSIPLKRQ